MYRGLELDGPTPPAAVQLSPHAISLGGMSKAYSMPGTRIGWLACHDVSLLSAMSQLKDYTTICSPPTSELLALAGLRGGRPILTANVARIKDNIALVDELIKRWDHVLAWTPPHAGSVAFPR